MNDRFTNGLLAGVLAGIAHASWSLTSRFILQWTEKSVAGFGALLSFNRAPEGLFEHIWGLLVFLGGSAGLGVVFVYFVRLVTSERLYLKAIFFSMASWFFIGDVIVPRISGTTEAPFTLGTVASAAAGSVLFGVVLAYTYNYFVNKSIKI